MRYYHTRISSFFLAVALCLCALTPLRADDIAEFHRLEKAGYLVTDSQGEPVHRRRAETLFIPASTVKLITALLSLQHWGEHHHFETRFFYDQSQSRLWVLASGDPFLVSEEIALIADALARLGIRKVDSIGIDASLFRADLVVPGATTTGNPYDAVSTALAANFNTVNIEKQGERVFSGEPQTPLTSTARALGRTLSRNGKNRINLGRNSRRSERYFAELLLHYMQAEGIKAAEAVVWGKVPVGDAVYVHRNTRSLGEVLQGMLKYSTNFIANQLLLTLAAEKSMAPADFKMAQTFLHQSLTELFDWKDFHLLEGAGLSPNNRLSARQLVDVLQRFVDWRHLLPEVNPGIVAKTGTLTSVKSLAGYAVDNNGGSYAFAILANESVPAELPVRTIDALVR